MGGTLEKVSIDFEHLPERFTWKDLEKEFQAFSPALLYWNTGFDRDIVSDFINRFPVEKDERPKMCIAPRPIFELSNPVTTVRIQTKMGLKERQTDWSRTIYFCPRHIWEREEASLQEWIRGTGFADRKSQSYSIVVRCPEMKILDQMSYLNHDFPPKLISIETFGVYDNQKCSIWRCDPSNWYKMPEAKLYTAAEVIVKDGEVFWRERS